MGIPLDVFSLRELRNEESRCRHLLLLRVGRAGFNNADEGEYAEVLDAADKAARTLIRMFEEKVLAGACAVRHEARLLGESQARPVGDELSEGRGGFYVELWVAETRFGHPWVVLGTAGDEEEFWREVARDEDLRSLGPRAPAKRLRAYLLTDKTAPGGA